ncbi:autotransporter outer membrane beta-barrel domain-containing protein [Fusobacterium varium]|uniref:autotransporter family protein n=2 Tax=Fusobacterium varium TaxID=856 RepID=UPI00305E7DF1
MIEKIIKAVIGFLLLCTAVMGADDNYLWIKKDGEIKFNTTAAIDADGSWSTTNPYANAGNIWDTITNTYTNNMTLSSSKANGKDGSYDISYGLRLSEDMTGLNFINNGSVIGIMSVTSSYSYGYGIYNSAKMGNITNRGVIIGGCGYGAGTGIYNSSNSGEIGTIRNTGVISGYSNGDGEGYGIYNSSGTIRTITNIGIISGYGAGKGHGIYNSGTLGTITNAGVISGSVYGWGNGDGYGIYNSEATIGAITNTGVISGTGTGSGRGYGIYNDSGTMGDIINTGVIYGENSAINGGGTKVNNYGILVNGSNEKITIENNYGLTIENNGGGKISAGIGGSQNISFYDAEKNIMGERKVKIENITEKNENKNNSFTGNENDSILNALKNTYKVIGTNNEVTGSIINAYGTAVVFEEANKQLTLSGTIVNGGIDNSAAISGSDNKDSGDTLILQSGEIKYTDNNGVEKSATQNTIVNGNIDMGEGADILTIGAGTIINGTLDGGTGSDILDFGVSSGARSNLAESEEVKILHNITGFENMNINTNVTLYEKTINASGEIKNLEVTGAENITIGANGVFTLRIDSTKKDKDSNKIIGHALYGNTGEISSTGGKLLLALNGAGNNEIISFGDTKLNSSLVTEYEGEYLHNNITFGTTSLLHSIKRVNETDNEVEVAVKKDLPLTSLKYEKLNKIYHGILSVKDLIANFSVDTDEKLSIFLGYLNDIYAGNPYSYSSELSRKSVGMFRDIATENQFKPELNKWLIMGGLTHVDGGTKDTYYGKGYYTYDIGTSDMDADTKITGAYMLGEYGASDTLTYGVVIGGNKLKSNLSNGSKVDGDALYMGAYAKKYLGNLKVTGGLGLQYGDYDADRLAVNKVASSLAEPIMKYSDNYNDMTYDIYLNGRYSNPMGDNFFLEPYGTLSYTYVDQDGADEGNKTLAIETDSKSFDYTTAKVGVDLKKVIPHEKGKSTLSAGVSYTRLLNGADEENITGRFKGGSDFDILVAHKNEHSVGLNARYTLELESGILFDVKGSYSFERDSHNGSGKNRNKGEWIAGTGLGYKF